MISDFKTKNLLKDGNLPKILKSVRNKVDLSISQVEKETRIKKEHLKALEKGDYSNLPEPVYVRGFLKKLAQLYGFDSTKLIEKYRLDSQTSSKKTEEDNIGFKNARLSNSVILITPRIITIALGTVVGLFLIGYLWFEVSGFAIAPKLAIERPSKQELEIKKDELVVSGQTDESATLSINQEPVPVDSDGNYNQTVKLQPGYNILHLEAKNKSGKITSKKIKIIVNKKYAWNK